MPDRHEDRKPKKARPLPAVALGRSSRPSWWRRLWAMFFGSDVVPVCATCKHRLRATDEACFFCSKMKPALDDESAIAVRHRVMQRVMRTRTVYAEVREVGSRRVRVVSFTDHQMEDVS